MRNLMKMAKDGSDKSRLSSERVEEQSARLAGELRERAKELRCVYAISNICENPGLSLEAVLRGIVELLPAAWQYPESACARLVSHAGIFKTNNFSPTRYRQKISFMVQGKKAGSVEVCYLRKGCRGAGPVFLKAERKLLCTVAERVGKIIELKNAELDLKSAHEKLHSLLQSVENSREEERRRIAHELHDELGHALMAIKIDLRCLRDSCPAAEVVLKKTRDMDSIIDATIHNLRRIAWELRPVLLDEFGLQAAISVLGKDFEARHGIRFIAHINACAGRLNGHSALTLYRITQELLTNAAKHAMATKVSLVLKKSGRGVAFIFRDNGKGISESAMGGKKTLGLLGIRERVHGCGGSLLIEGKRNRGTTISITMPLTQNGERK